jgi:2-oxoglutarate dehydrogenase E2 component (dihydrolipoamide succinyltransferase)
MATEIRVPQMGESVTEGVIATWLKAEGESVSADEPVVEVETDKITIEVPAPAAGVLRKQGAAEGATVAVGDIIGEIEEGAGQSQQSTPAPEQRDVASGADAASPSTDGHPARNGRAHAVPSARAEAARTGVDLDSVTGSGRGGRILKEDVIAARTRQTEPSPAAQLTEERVAKPTAPSGPARERDASAREERKPMTPIRRRVAERLVESQHTAAILTTFNEIDMSKVIEVRKRWKDRFVEEHGVKLGFMSFFVKATVDALKHFPPVNAEIDGDDVVYKYHYDIGVAVGGGKGLVVPVIRDADRLSFAELELQIADFGTRAKNGKLTLDDLSGGTFTVSNGGVYGSMMSTPILNPPQTGILGLHNIVERPVAVQGQVEIRPVMFVALSYDHRLIDGREAVQFLVRIKALMEDPERLFLGV